MKDLGQIQLPIHPPDLTYSSFCWWERKHNVIIAVKIVIFHTMIHLVQLPRICYLRSKIIAFVTENHVKKYNKNKLYLLLINVYGH